MEYRPALQATNRARCRVQDPSSWFENPYYSG
jgi:hypothetical protein